MEQKSSFSYEAVQPFLPPRAWMQGYPEMEDRDEATSQGICYYACCVGKYHIRLENASTEPD